MLAVPEVRPKPSQSQRASAVELLDRVGRICVIDVESSSLSPEDGRVVELALVHYKGATMAGSFSTVIRGQFEPTTFHNEVPVVLVKEAPTFEDVVPIVQSFIESCDVILAQNTQFDLRWLAKEFERVGVKIKLPPALDLIPAAKAAFPGRDHYNLDEIVKMTGTAVHHPRHRALSDCQTEYAAFVDVVTVLVGEGKVNSTVDLEDFLVPGQRRSKARDQESVPSSISEVVDRLAERASRREILSQDDDHDRAILSDYASRAGMKIVQGAEFFASIGSYEVWEPLSEDADTASTVREILTEAGLWDAVSELSSYDLARALAKGLIPDSVRKNLEEFGALRRIRRVKLHPAQ